MRISLLVRIRCGETLKFLKIFERLILFLPASTGYWNVVSCPPNLFYFPITLQTPGHGLEGGNMVQFSVQARYLSCPRKVQPGSASHPIQLVVKRPRRETNDLPPSTAEVKNCDGHAHNLRTCFHGVHMDSCALKWHCGVNKALRAFWMMIK